MPGRTPQKNARRPSSSRASRSDWVQLPAAGFAGPVPAWPIGSPDPATADLWSQLWRTPQAKAWLSLGWTRTVARYATLVIACEGEAMTAALLAEVRQMEDRLGLSPMAMKRLQWEIVADVAAVEADDDNVVELFG